MSGKEIKKTDVEKAVDLIDTLFCDLENEDINELYEQEFPGSDPYRELHNLSLKLRREMLAKGQSVPEHVKKIIRGTEKSEHKRDQEKVKLGSVIKDVLSSKPIAPSQFSYAFRNRESLTDGDKAHIKELEDELLDELQDDEGRL